MTRSALAKVATRKALRDTWDDFWKQSRSQSAPGVDGVTLAAFNKNREWNIGRVYQEMEAGYKFSPLRPFTVEKSNGKKRIICVPTVKDRLVQRLISNHLTSQADRLGILNEVSFGFVNSTASNPRGVGAARDRAFSFDRNTLGHTRPIYLHFLIAYQEVIF